jgi:hypothetical protein
LARFRLEPYFGADLQLVQDEFAADQLKRFADQVCQQHRFDTLFHEIEKPRIVDFIDVIVVP